MADRYTRSKERKGGDTELRAGGRRGLVGRNQSTLSRGAAGSWRGVRSEGR